jgi:dienelactone hydrolase
VRPSRIDPAFDRLLGHTVASAATRPPSDGAPSTSRPLGGVLGAAIVHARRAVTSAAASVDRGVMRWTEERLRRARQDERAARLRRGEPAPSGEALRGRALELAAAYGAGTRGSPSPFFPTPERPALALTPLGARGAGPKGSTVYDVRHPSSYQPYWAGARDAYLTYRENLTSHARWWRLPRRDGAPRPAVLVIHGWRAGAHWVSERVFEVPYWLGHGFDVISFQLPLHGERTPEGVASGALFLTRNLARTNEAFGNAIYDLRALADALRGDHGVTTLGALGMSLGGYTAALWASVGDELDFAIAMIPAVEMHKLMLRSAGARERSGGVDEALLDDVFAVHAPLGRPPRLPAERLFVIAGDGDQITPPEQAQALIDHWRCPSHWFAGGHLAQIGRLRALRAARLHLAAGGIAGEVRRAP